MQIGHSSATDRRVLAAITVVLILYLGAAWLGWPQAGAEVIAREGALPAIGSHPEVRHPGSEDGHIPAEQLPPPLAMVVPFALLLGAIALLPLIPFASRWWQSNLNRFYVAGGLALVTLLCYLLVHAGPVERHFLGHDLVLPGKGALSWELTGAVLANAILHEYVPFITLLFSLYTICGGIRIAGDLPAHPLTNTMFLAVGGLLASFIGTTGAAMVLIRPLLETNAERQRVQHTVIFFIFVVCNCGGCLLPIGDPPLFLGYLRGVPFLWTFSLWQEWLFVNGVLLAVYYLWDRLWAHPRESAAALARDETRLHRLRFSGIGLGALLLLGVVLSVALLDSSKPLPGTDWIPWLYLREAVQLGLVGLSLLFGSRHVRGANRFNYHAIVEVAALFVGIFICMQPALQILDARGPDLGLRTAQQFFWWTGGLSSVLDNAPSYLVFLETASALPHDPQIAGAGVEPVGVGAALLTAISLGSVFMGAMTYIGNGPNFMVKAIAEQSGVRMPGFLGYLLYSTLVLLPLLVVMTWIFLP
ncbi:MAG: sodium:proton antiporter [Pirellulales bacterium]